MVNNGWNNIKILTNSKPGAKQAAPDGFKSLSK